MPSSTVCTLSSSQHPRPGTDVCHYRKLRLPLFTKWDKHSSLCPLFFPPPESGFSILCNLHNFSGEWWGKWADEPDFYSALRPVWTPIDPINRVLEMMRSWNCVIMAISITSTQLESHSNWDVFPTQVIYENWDEDEPNNHEELEHCVTFNGSPQMRWNRLCYRSPQMHWNNLRCEDLRNWICETKKGMITSLFNWSNKCKFKTDCMDLSKLKRRKILRIVPFKASCSGGNT